jgi:actin-related protein 5
MAKRRTAAAQERMRLISQLARKEKRDDNFGMRDEDWDVYKAINKVLITRCTCRTGEM